MLVHERLPEEIRQPRAGAGAARASQPVGLLALQALAGNGAVASLLAGRPGGPRPLPHVQRCGPAAPDCNCGPEEKEAAAVGAPGQEQDHGQDDAHDGGGVCLTCEALRAARDSPGGAIAYVASGGVPQWRPPAPTPAPTPGPAPASGRAPAAPSVRTDPLTGDESDDGSAAGGLAANLVDSSGGAAGAGDLTQNPEEAVASPGDPGGSAGRPEHLRHDPSDQAPPPVMVPVSATAGASVVCKGHNTYEVWQNPSEPACVQPCEKKHEEKHIADFNADANYKATVKCASLPDGETFTYASNADAARFECAASDVEIACLSAQIAKETDESCKTMATRRRDVILPNYKKGFGC